MASLAYPYVRRCVVAFCDAAFAAVFTSRIAPIAYVLSAPLSELCEWRSLREPNYIQPACSLHWVRLFSSAPL